MYQFTLILLFNLEEKKNLIKTLSYLSKFFIFVNYEHFKTSFENVSHKDLFSVPILKSISFIDLKSRHKMSIIIKSIAVLTILSLISGSQGKF
jgi:hypothetical protein